MGGRRRVAIVAAGMLSLSGGIGGYFALPASADTAKVAGTPCTGDGAGRRGERGGTRRHRGRRDRRWTASPGATLKSDMAATPCGCYWPRTRAGWSATMSVLAGARPVVIVVNAREAEPSACSRSRDGRCRGLGRIVGSGRPPCVPEASVVAQRREVVRRERWNGAVQQWCEGQGLAVPPGWPVH